MGRMLAGALLVLLTLPILAAVAFWRPSAGRSGDAVPDPAPAPAPDAAPHAAAEVSPAPTDQHPAPAKRSRRARYPWARLVALVLLLFAIAATVGALVAAFGLGAGTPLADGGVASPLAILAAGLWCALVVWKVPQWQATAWRGDRYVDPKEAFEVENGARGTIGQLVSGLAILAGLYFGWQQLGQTTQNLQVSEQGQITDRFSRAIDQLGDDELTVRLGGIYALERIARDSPRDYAATMEVLAAFARRAGATTATPVAAGTSADPLPQDLEAVMQVIGRRTPDQVAQEKSDGLDCLHLEKIQLNGIELGGANLMGLCLGGASLADAQLPGANLSGSSLVGTNLTSAKLDTANLSGANLAGAVLTGASLGSADLQGTKLNAANLSGASLLAADAQGAELAGANLSGAILLQTDFRDAGFLDADFTNAQLSGADLRGARLLTTAQIDAAFTDSTNKLPVGIAATPDI